MLLARVAVSELDVPLSELLLVDVLLLVLDDVLFEAPLFGLSALAPAVPVSPNSVLRSLPTEVRAFCASLASPEALEFKSVLRSVRN